jgi:uncharacterized protein (DUF302 family)
MKKNGTSIGYEVELHTDFDNALDRVTVALKAEGFGVLTEIDVQATFKKKLAKEFRPYKILGACNPPIAYNALSAMPEVGLLLPCNVIVDQVDDDTVMVSLIDPMAMLGVLDNPEMNALAQEVDERLQRTVKALASSDGGIGE